MVDGAEGATGTEAPHDERAREGARKDARWRSSDPIRQGLGVLSALKDALDETIREARERGDLAPERAKEAVRTAFARAQEAAGEARERFDFIPRSEYERLREQVEEMRVRLENLERRAAQGPGVGEARPEGS